MRERFDHAATLESAVAAAHDREPLRVVSQGKVIALLFPDDQVGERGAARTSAGDPAVLHHIQAAISLATGCAYPDAPTRNEGALLHVVYAAHDSAIYVDGIYVIRGVAGAILRKVLEEHTLRGRREFCSREVRLDRALQSVDNFEVRLLMLVRRLQERALGIALEKTGRGRFRLVLDRPVQFRVR